MRHEDYHVIEVAFIDGFRTAPDKRAFLHLAHIPHEIESETGSLKLLEVKLHDAYAVGTASPGFGSAELVYHALPGEMVTRRTRLSFVYVSTSETRELSLVQVLTEQGETINARRTDVDHLHHCHNSI